MDETDVGQVTEKLADQPRGKRVTGRSPMYPFFDLERSVARARQLFEKEKIHATPVMTALRHWGYTNSSGKAGMTLSALKQFGLLDDLGRGDGRRVQLTTRAYDILNTPHEGEREQLLREAALDPEIHQEMWEQYGTSLPSADSLAWTLTKERGFTSSGAEDFIRQWTRTLEYARLGDTAEVDGGSQRDDAERTSTLPSPPEEPDMDDLKTLMNEVRTTAMPAAATLQPLSDVQSYPIPIALQGRVPVVVTGPFPLSEAEWTQFMAVLTAMKPVLAGAEE